LQLENLALRHQIGVFQCSAKKSLSLENSDRLLWIGLARVWTDWRSALVIVTPETVIASHREAFRMFWTWKVPRAKPGAPSRSPTMMKSTAAPLVQPARLEGCLQT
jgi:hypothetical protein